MAYNVLKEDPPNTGVYVDTGEVLEGDEASVVGQIVLRTQIEGMRYAIFPNDPVNRRQPTVE
jgi:hypothetical protein